MLYLSCQRIPLIGHFEDKDSLNQVLKYPINILKDKNEKFDNNTEIVTGNFKEAYQLLNKFNQQFAKKYNCIIIQLITLIGQFKTNS